MKNKQNIYLKQNDFYTGKRLRKVRNSIDITPFEVMIAPLPNNNANINTHNTMEKQLSLRLSLLSYFLCED